MRIYMAAMYLHRAGYAILMPAAEQYPWSLESYHYLKDSPRTMDPIKKRGASGGSIFLDSGAFTMFTGGIKVDLAQYADYIKANKQYIHTASNIDEIGSGKEETTWRNQKTLERMGVQIQPVFHARDDDKWLQKYMAEGYDYIFLGGMVKESTKYLREWLDHVYGKYLTRKDGTPKVKIHGFGLTTFELMSRYPWFSVDSTSWLMSATYGVILLDMPHGIVKLQVSEKSNRAKDWDMHYDTMPEVKKRVIDAYIQAEGYDVALLKSEYGWRNHFNVNFFKKLLRHPDPVFIARRQAASLF